MIDLHFLRGPITLAVLQVRAGRELRCTRSHRCFTLLQPERLDDWLVAAQAASLLDGSRTRLRQLLVGLSLGPHRNPVERALDRCPPQTLPSLLEDEPESTLLYMGAIVYWSQRPGRFPCPFPAVCDRLMEVAAERLPQHLPLLRRLLGRPV